MYLSKMINKKKNLILPAIFTLLVFGAVALPQHFSFAVVTKPQPLEVVGMAKFVLKGAVLSVTVDTITLHITNTSKNAKLFDNKDKTIHVGGKTAITKNGKNIKVGQIKSGDKVKIFGVFDKKSGSITLVRWIKVMPK